MTFATAERLRQIEFFDGTDPERALFRDIPYRFAQQDINLAPEIREVARTYFERDGEKTITWHTHANHALSSQVCCLNFLMPIARDRERVARFISSALQIDYPEVEIAEEVPSGTPWYIGFEWTGTQDYLNEQVGGRPVKRGSNSTSADAFVRFRHGNKRHAVLIEWKYTESYGPALADKRRPDGTGGYDTRTRRYGNIACAPSGPIRGDLGLELEDFFWEPFYQLLRQQMLAHKMEEHGEADVVRVLHLSPRGNLALHKVTAPTLRARGEDAFEVFRSLLVQPDRFVNRTIEDVFKPLLLATDPSDPWRQYLETRYRFLNVTEPERA